MIPDKLDLKLGTSPNGLRLYGTAAVVVILIFIDIYVMFATESAMQPSEIVRGTSPNEQTESTIEEIDSVRKRVAKAFIEDLQKATTLAAGGENERVWYNKEARAKWNRDNPCLSRKEMPRKYSRRKYVRDLDPNPKWQAVLKEYARLHRTCMHRIGDPTAYYMSRNTSINCKFVVADSYQPAGLGNRVLVIASAAAYAVLTNRVLLIAGGTDILAPGLLCEPFEGSSWQSFDPERKANPFRGENKHWNKSSNFYARIEAAQRLGNSSAALPLVSDYAIASDVQPDSRSYCDTGQEYVKNVTWVYFRGCFNFMPKYWTVPSFRPILDALFPDRMVLTRILRDMLTPADPVWTRVKNFDRGYLKQADRRLGVQLRYREGRREYDNKHIFIEERVLQCAINNRILPPMQDPSKNTTAHPPPALKNPPTISVFVASLYEGLRSRLTDTFLRHPTATGEGVQVVQISNEGFQKFGGEVFQEALTEILILSFSDYLFVTPLSTFSGMAQAYGGLVPWFIDYRPNITLTGPCTRAQTVDVCFQIPIDYNIKCPYDIPSHHNKPISDVYTDVQRCLEVDTPGLQVITKNDLSMEKS